MSAFQNVINKARGAAEAAKDGIGTMVTAAAESDAGKATLGAAQEAARTIDGVAERTGTKAAFGAVSGKVTDGLDSLTGENVMRELQRRLDRQDELNDSLANRLHEALTRIEALERQVASAEVQL